MHNNGLRLKYKWLVGQWIMYRRMYEELDVWINVIGGMDVRMNG